MKNNTDTRLVELLLNAAKAETIKKAVFSKPSDKAMLRAVSTLRKLGGKTVLQTEFLHRDNKATHENTDPKAYNAVGYFLSLAGGFSQINLITTAGECELRRSANGKTVLLGADKLARALSDSSVEKADISGNDRAKNHILSGSEPFLIKLGISDSTGRPHDKRLPKLRQINRFLEYVADIESRLPQAGTLHICDLCCGKSYLSFAVYHYFANIRGRKVRMTGVDLKADVIEYCNEVAMSLGFDGLYFVCGDISAYEPEVLPSLVVSLHACDTATDLVLNKASAWRTQVILSTPCCHHEMNHRLNCPELSFIAEHSMLRQKFCDAATDSLRLKKLQAEGYSVEAVELVDPDDTPKNILLRAVCKGKEDGKAKAEYEAALRLLYGDTQ